MKPHRPIKALQPFAPNRSSNALAGSMADSLIRNDWKIEKSGSLYVAELSNARGTLTYMGDLFSNTFVVMVDGIKKEVGFFGRLRLYFAVRNEFQQRLKNQRAELKDAHLSDAFGILQGV